MRLTKETKDQIVFSMRTHGVHRAAASFSGGGDSGQFDGVNCSTITGTHLPTPEFPVILNYVLETEKYNSSTGTYTREEIMRSEEKPFDAALEQLCMDALSESGHDWYNNEGGQGEYIVEVDSTAPDGYTFKLEVGINETKTTDYEYSY